MLDRDRLIADDGGGGGGGGRVKSSQVNVPESTAYSLYFYLSIQRYTYTYRQDGSRYWIGRYDFWICVFLLFTLRKGKRGEELMVT
jgi:hypothetical protein